MLPYIPIQGFADLENVNGENMNTFYATMSTQLSTYFPIVSSDAPTFGGSICSGVGNITNNFGQVGTTNVFNFVNGAIRFVDQITNLSADRSPKACYANLNASAVTVTCPISATQYYVVAMLGFNTPSDPYTTSTLVTISTTAMTLAQIAATAAPALYAPLFAITNTAGVYSVSLDGHCAFNYGYLLDNPFPDITDIGGLVSITGSGGLSVPNGISNLTNFIATYSATGITTMVQSNGINALIQAAENATGNFCRAITQVNTTSHQSTVSLQSYLGGTLQYNLIVADNVRPNIQVNSGGSVSGAPGANDIVVGQNLSSYASAITTVNGGLGPDGSIWFFNVISIGGVFPNNNLCISGYVNIVATTSPNSGTSSYNLVTAGILPAVNTNFSIGPAINNSIATLGTAPPVDVFGSGQINLGAGTFQIGWANLTSSTQNLQVYFSIIVKAV